MHRYTFQPWPRTRENFRIPTVILPRRKENPSFEERFRTLLGIGNSSWKRSPFFRSLKRVSLFFFFFWKRSSRGIGISTRRRIELRISDGKSWFRVGGKRLKLISKKLWNERSGERRIEKIWWWKGLVSIRRGIRNKHFFSALTQVRSCEHLSRASTRKCFIYLRDSSYRLDRSDGS